MWLDILESFLSSRELGDTGLEFRREIWDLGCFSLGMIEAVGVNEITLGEGLEIKKEAEFWGTPT